MARSKTPWLWVFLACVSTGGDAASLPPIEVKVLPRELVTGEGGQVIVTVDARDLQKSARLELQAPPGFHVEPNEFAVSSAAGRQEHVAHIATPIGSNRKQKRALQIRFLDSEDGTLLAAKAVEFDFTPELTLSLFIAIAALGIAAGYGLRLLIGILKAVPAPSPAPPRTSEGPITSFVKKHYYLVDLGVTVALGFVILVGLSTDGRPPESARLWPGALATGVGLGLLTNSSLLTKIR